MNVALVHDYLSQDGGAERVLAAMHALWPKAPIFTLFHDRERANSLFLDADIRTTFLQQIPFGLSHYRWMLPLMPFAVERIDLRDFDLVISNTSAFAKGILTRPETLHISYCHTPTRYLWMDTHSYVEELPTNFFVKRGVPFLLSRLRVWDRHAADRVDHFIANSRTVAERILKYYRRESRVLYPPVEVDRFTVGHGHGEYFLAGGRLVAYKRFDLVVAAFNRLGLPLKIFGVGPEREKLEARAQQNIEFVGAVSDTKKGALYRDAVAFINPQIEDFGITVVEAMAAGRPVICYKAGGARESVVEGTTGVFFGTQTWEALFDTVLNFDASRYDASRIRAHAEQFSSARFNEELASYIEEKWKEFIEVREALAEPKTVVPLPFMPSIAQRT